MNFIGIDPSLISTAIAIETPKGTKLFSFYKDKKLGKWEKLAEDTVSMHFISLKDYKKMSYSEEQIAKHIDYDEIVEKITSVILDNIDDTEDTYVAIEGYSYSSSAGPLIDLVTFSTLLRDNILKYVTTNITIIAPGELKKGCAIIVYDKGEDGSYRNNELAPNKKGIMVGTAGGSFDKHDMARSMIDYYGKTGNIINDNIHDFLMGYKEEIFNLKGFPKPFDDIIDSIWAKEIMKHRLAVMSA